MGSGESTSGVATSGLQARDQVNYTFSLLGLSSGLWGEVVVVAATQSWSHTEKIPSGTWELRLFPHLYSGHFFPAFFLAHGQCGLLFPLTVSERPG